MAKTQNFKRAIKVICYIYIFFGQFLKVQSGAVWKDLALKSLLQ